MHIFTLDQFILDRKTHIAKIRGGAIFVYPTDTVYGIGGIVTSQVVSQINAFKQRKAGAHYSIIAPSFSWIEEHFDVGSDFEAQRKLLKLQRAPTSGFTLLLPIKEDFQSHFSILTSSKQLGVRIIDHPIQDIVKELGEPIITTSANISGQDTITNLRGLTNNQTKQVQFAIDGGTLCGTASVIIEFGTGKRLR